MTPRSAFSFDRQRIVVADQDSLVRDMIVDTLCREGHCVFVAPGALSAAEMLAGCHLLISDMCVGGVVRMNLLESLREQWPGLPVLFLAREGQLPGNLPSLCVPFTPQELQGAVRRLLPALQGGTVLAHQTATVTAAAGAATN